VDVLIRGSSFRLRRVFRGRPRVAWSCALVAALLLLLPSAAPAWDPPGWRVSASARAEGPTSPAALPFAWAIGFYRATVSRVDGDRCPSYPTCSEYAAQAFRLHGPLLGLTLTANRLISEADEAAFAPRIQMGDVVRVYSPVEDDLAFLRGHLAP
jgi:hypothetical protein